MPHSMASRCAENSLKIFLTRKRHNATLSIVGMLQNTKQQTQGDDMSTENTTQETPPATPPVLRERCADCNCLRKPCNLRTLTDGRKLCKDCYANYRRCACCGAVRKSDDMRVVGAYAIWCADCATSHAATCTRCHEWHPKVRMLEYNGSMYCSCCIMAVSEQCEHCGVRVAKGTLQWANNGATGYCDACAGEMFVSCGDCGESFTVTLRPYCGELLCGTCRSNRPRAIYDYHAFDRKLTFHGEGRYIGFELEAGKATSSDCQTASEEVLAIDPKHNHYHCEQDGSIPYYGYELISMPHDIAAMRAYDWGKPLGIMEQHGLKSNSISGCGLHVHISRKGLSPVDLAKIDLFAAHNRAWLEMVARRTEEGYARFKGVRGGDWGGSRAGRYQAINFRPEATIEFRLWKGTLNPAYLMGCVELSLAIVEFCQHTGVMQLIQGKGAIDSFKSFLAAGDYPAAVAYVAKIEAKAAQAGKKVL